MPCPCTLRVPPTLLAWLLVAAVVTSTTTSAQQLDADARREVVMALGDLMAEQYVFEEQGKLCRRVLLDELAEGSFDGAAGNESLAQALTEVLQRETDDKHLRVQPWARQPPEPTPEEMKRMEAARLLEARQSNFGFEQVLRVPGNVGIVDLRGFSGVEHGATAAHGAMAYLSSCDALIFDLRQNGGGDPDMVQLLCSYLFDEKTHLNSLWFRGDEQPTEFWTLDELPGPRLPDVPVFVLTSAYTFSGAEEFAYNLRTRERATLVGETTGGGAHPGGTHLLPHQMGVFISHGRAINPVTGTNWEGTGVEPHVRCPADAALDKALGLATRAAQDHRDALEQRLTG